MAKTRVVDADAQCQRDDGSDGETPILDEHANGEAHVLRDVLQRRRDPDVARLIARERVVAECAAAGGVCCFECQPARFVLPPHHLAMERHLLSQIVVVLAVVEGIADAGEERSQAHGATPIDYRWVG